MYKSSLTLCAAAMLLTVPSNLEALPSPDRAISLFPAQPGMKITYNGEQGTRATHRDGRLEIRREELTNQPGMRWNIQLSPALNLAEFPSAATLKLRLRGGKPGQEYHLATHWYFNAPRSHAGRQISFTGGPAWQELELPVPRRSASGNETGMLVLHFNAIAAFDVERIQLGESRPVGIELVSAPERAATEMVLRGRTLHDGTIALTLRNAAGQPETRQATAVNGVFEYVWKNPPLSVHKYNMVTASTGTGTESLPLPVFGYRDNYDFAWLKVKGTRIVTAAESKEGEQPFVAAGIGYCRDVIISNQDDAVMEFCKARGLNTVRLSFYTRYFNNNLDQPVDLDTHIRDFIDPVIQAAKRHNLYVILDDHGYFSEKIDESKAREHQAAALWSEEGVAEWASRWRQVADYYKDEPHILGYELMNEPHDIKPELARDWYIRAIKAIREVDTRHILLVGSCDWSHARSLEKTWGELASTADAPYHNLAFAFHDYPEDNHPWVVKEHVLRFRDTHQVPVMCTEFGATHWNKSETVCREFQAGMLAFCAQSDTGWMIWALGKLTDHPRNPYNEVDRTGLGPPRTLDSCAYSDLWSPVAKIMATPFPQPQ